MKHLKVFIIGMALLQMGCGGSGNGKKSPTDTYSAGSIWMVADDAYQPMVDAEIKVYEALYQGTTIHVKYETEDSVFKDLMAYDTLRLAIASRKLTKQEEDYFHAKTYEPEEVKIATDAVALIVNNSNPDSLFTLKMIRDIFTGKDSTWDAVNPKSKLGAITVVFDHENSSNSRYINENILKGQKFPSYCFAVHGNSQVIDYVNKHPGAMGIIGINWVSDTYDSTVMKFLSQVHIVGLSTKDNPALEDYYQPYQAYMKMDNYPLCRDVYIIKTEPRMGLGTGFTSFVAGDKGQRIILRAGLLPATIPTRVVKF
jgi:phosphate transport system substrate-binding protein